MIIGFLVEDRASLLTCALAGNSFYCPSRSYLFAEIEVNSLQRFQTLLDLSATSLTIFEHDSIKPFSFIRTILLRDVDAWITQEVLPSLLFLPLLAPFPNVKELRIDDLTIHDHVEAETLLTSLLCMGPQASGGVPVNEPFAEPRGFPSPTSLKALSLRNCHFPTFGWFLRYVSHFTALLDMSLTDFTWGSLGAEGTESRSPAFQYPRQTLQLPTGLSKLTLKNQYTPLSACAPRQLFESLFGNLTTLRMMHMDIFHSVG